MNKYKNKSLKSQALKQQISTIYKDFFDSPAIVMRVLAECILLKKQFRCVYASLSYIGKKVKRDRSYVGKIVRSLVAKGYLELEERPSKTHVYHINKILYSHRLYSFLMAVLSSAYIFSLSNIRSDQACPQYTNIKDVIYKRTGTSTVHTTGTYKQVLYITDNIWLYNSTEKGVPNKKLSSEQAEELFGDKKEPMMLAFTTEQQETINQYPKVTIDYAHKILGKDLLAGKEIVNHFNYFLSICRNHAAKEQQPKTGYTPQKTSVASPHVKEWAMSDDTIRQKLLDRKNRIKAKAVSMGIPIEGYTLGEIELMINGYTVVNNQSVTLVQPAKIRQGDARVIDWNKLIPNPTSDTHSFTMNDESVLTEPIPFQGDNLFEEVLD